MVISRMLLALPIVALFAATGLAQDAAAFPAGTKSVECINPNAATGGGFSTPFSCASERCMDPNCTECCPERGSWWGRKTRSVRRWWQRKAQSKKGLQHPAYAPLCEPNWGYHQTCWRRFPAIVCPCPPAEPAVVVPSLMSPPVPSASRGVEQGDAKNVRFDSKDTLPMLPLDEKIWRASGESKQVR